MRMECDTALRPSSCRETSVYTCPQLPVSRFFKSTGIGKTDVALIDGQHAFAPQTGNDAAHGFGRKAQVTRDIVARHVEQKRVARVPQAMIPLRQSEQKACDSLLCIHAPQQSGEAVV